MGATRLPTTPDAVYAASHARYLRNREKLLARAKVLYAEEKPVRQAAAKALRDAAREARLLEKRRAAYASRNQTPPAERGTKAADYLRTYKTDKPCLDCELVYPPCVMDFDHVRGVKSKIISNIMTITALQREIAKCDLVCANCHRIRTFKRGQHLTPIKKFL